MPLVPINDVGQVGIVRDIPPYQLPPNVWSNGNNVRFLDNGVKKCAGYEEVFATLPFAAYYVIPFLDNGGTYHWIAFGLSNTAVWTGSAWVDITRQNTTTLNGALSASDSSIVLTDSSIFPSSGSIAIGTNETADLTINLYEEITYGANNTGTNTLSTLTVANAHPTAQVVTPIGTTATGDDLYSATVAENWRATILNGLLVATNGYDTPQMWPLTLGVPSTTTPMRELKNWQSPSSYCKSISAFRTFLVGLNWQIGGVEYPNLVKWSTEAAALNPPASWVETDLELDTGEYQLTDTPGKIIDGLPYGDSFLIYKEDSIYIMNYVGTPYVFGFKLLSPTIGLLSKNAVAEFDQGHFFIGNSDCYMTNGQQVQALLPNRLRREMFEDLNGENYSKVFVVADYARNEMLACYPAGISTVPNKALIWNWRENTFSIRAIPDLSHINAGIAAITTGTTWNSHTEEWNVGSGIWGVGNYDTVLKNLVFVKSDNKASISGATKANPVVVTTTAAHGLSDSDKVSISGIVGMVEINANVYYAKVTGYSTTTFALYSDSALTTTVDGSGYTTYVSGGAVDQPKLYRDDRGHTEDGTNMTSYIERTGYDLGDPASVKYVSAVWPKLEVTGDNSMSVYVGRQMSTEDAIFWEGPYSFNPNDNSKVSCRVSGKYFGIKVESSGDFDWKLHGLSFEVVQRGTRGKRDYA